MAEDGRIIIDTKINSDGIEKGEKEIRAKLSKVARDLDLKVNIKSNAVDVLKEKINGLNDVINKNRDIMSKGFGVSLDDFIKARDKVKSAEESLNSYKSILSSSSNELEKLKINQEAYNRTLAQMKAPDLKITSFTDKIKNYFNTTGNEVPNPFDFSFDRMYKSGVQLKELLGNIGTSSVDILKKFNAKNASLSIEQLSNSIGINLTSASKKASKAIFNMLTGIPSMVSLAKSAFGGLASSISSLGSRLLSIFSYQVLRQIIRKIIKEFMQGIADLEVYSSRFGNTMQSMKDSFKNLGNSIVTAVAPIIQALAPVLNWLLGAITKVFNTISMFTGALFTNAKTVTIADTSFSGYGKKIEKVDKATKKAKKDTGDMIKALAKFDKLDVLKKDKKKADIGGGVASAVPEVNPAMKMFKEVKVPEGILNLVERIKKTFEPLTDFFKEVGNSFLTSFVNPVISHFQDNFLPRFANNFSKFMSEFNFKPLENALDNVFKALAPLTNLAMDGLNWGLENVIYPMLKWTGEAYMPAILNMIAAAIRAINKAIEIAKPTIKNIYENEIKPLFEFLGNMAIGIIKKIESWLDGLADWMGKHPEEVEAFVKTLWDFGKALLAIWAVCKLILGLKALWDLITTVDPIMLGIKLTLFAIAGIIYLINRYGDQWKKWLDDVWEKLQKVSSIFGAIGKAFKASENMSSIKAKIETGELTPEQALEESKKFHRKLNGFKIPKLATGTVVSPNKKFLAMLGDNTSEKEVVSPISTMKQAFSEALNEYGGDTREAILQLDGETFARLINPYSKAENNRLGISMVSGV